MDPTTAFVELVQGPENDILLDRATLLIAAHAYPDLDVEAELGLIDELAAGCPEPTLEGWRQHLFVTLGFHGNVEEYYDPENSFLNQVVRRQVGLPITLSVLAMEVGRRLGLSFVGVGMPGHFLLRHQAEPVTYVDPFAAGRLLDEEGCIERFREMHGPETPFLPSYLDAVGPRAILARMLANLKAIYARLGNLEGLAWVYALRLAIPGVPAIERRELARVLGSTGRFAEAAHELEAMADTMPDQEDALRSEATALRARLN